MTDPRAIQQRFGSLFVATAFLHTLSSGISMNTYMTVAMAGAPARPGKVRAGANTALPLLAWLRAAQDICAQTFLADADAVEDMLNAVKVQFDVDHDCTEDDEEAARDISDHVFKLAARSARATWSEVAAGFPSSHGDLARWMEELSERRSVQDA